MTAPGLLRLDGVSVRLGGRAVVREASLDVGSGELVGLIGPNGAGKSTLLRAAIGLWPCTGEVALLGDSLDRLTPRERARRCAFLPQEREVGWPVSVETLVALGRSPHRTLGSGLGERDRELVEEAMQRLDVTDLRHRAATELSGGERARVLIARALAQDAPVLLADEPTAGLDPSHQIALMGTFRQLVREGGSGDGRAVVVSLHDLGLAARWCDRLVVMNGGRIVADGAPAEVLTAERLRDVYGIEAHFATDGDGLLVVPLALATRSEGARGKGGEQR